MYDVLCAYNGNLDVTQISRNMGYQSHIVGASTSSSVRICLVSLSGPCGKKLLDDLVLSRMEPAASLSFYVDS